MNAEKEEKQRAQLQVLPVLNPTETIRVQHRPSKGVVFGPRPKCAGSGYFDKGVTWFLVKQCDCQKCDSAAGKAQVAEDRGFKANEPTR